MANYDIFIIGSGAAGLGLALSLADEASIAIISKDDLLAGSSQYAQGGIAAVLEQSSENLNAHIQDTLKAGAGLCDPNVVKFTVNHAKEAIQWLVRHGVRFTVDPKTKRLHLTKEGGHSQRRILHAADRTGTAIVNTLVEQVIAHPNIHCYSQHTAIDIIIKQGQCIGVYVLENCTKTIKTFYAKETVLACGGASSVYLHTTNPDFTSGDGIAMAARANAVIKQMEFNQFHPTCLYYSGKRPFLISEALRGEGGKLILPNGKRFMDQYDVRAELAPRDIVTRAIHDALQNNHLNYVYLDITHLTPQFIQTAFPTIYHYCYQYGIDITRQPIPVVPAAHYTCGGVATNLHAQTNIPHLYAVGEVACTGLHGANRLASNSLLECLVFAMNAGRFIQQSLKNNVYLSPHDIHFHCQKTDGGSDQDQHNDNDLELKPELEQALNKKIQTVRELMWNNVGIVRHNEQLKLAKQHIDSINQAINKTWELATITRKRLEYRNLIQTASLIVNAAYQRKENCGLHYNVDQLPCSATSSSK